MQVEDQTFAPPPSAELRHLLIGLNAVPDLPRASLCVLGRDLGPWLHSAAPSQADTKLARQLGLPRLHLEQALSELAGCEDRAATELSLAEQRGERIVTRLDPDYPACLHDLPLPPPVLYLSGRLPALPGISIVGSRATDDYGREVAEVFAEELARAGLTVVSGFARGVDGAAHRGAVNAPGATVAVLGCGLDVSYPRAHGQLRQRVAEHGALVSEFSYGTYPRGWQFPVRNRVIAAMGRGTLVVRAAARSGSLITARLALELGREVFAIPGRIFDRGGPGPNSLIRDGAYLVQHPREILEALHIPTRLSAGAEDDLRARHRDEPHEERAPDPGSTSDSTSTRKLPQLPGQQGEILAAIPTATGRTAEEIATTAGCGIERTLALLLDLELAGRVRRLPGPTFTRGDG